MAVTTDSFTEGRLRERLGRTPPRRDDGSYNLPGVNLSRLSLTKAQLAGANLRGSSLRVADLMRAVLENADLRGADLTAAKLQRADLRGADLRGADLRRAVFNGTRVSGAQFSGASLEESIFRSVPLWETDLVPDELSVAAEVDLSEALLTVDPTATDVEAALSWCQRIGNDDERYAVRDLLRDRRWRTWRRQLREVLRALDQRIGPLSSASISRARPNTLDERSVSRARPPSEEPGSRSISVLRDQMRQLRSQLDSDPPEAAQEPDAPPADGA